jgi:type I restriction enzyme S subunit
MTTATQKIPSGYKQTEIGVIPTDWDVKKLGDIVQFNNGKAHERFIDDKGDFIVVNSKFISTAGEVFKNSFENLSPLSVGDIAMVMSDIPNGKALAKCFFVDKNGKYTLNQRICAFKSNGTDSLYLFYKLNRNKYFLDFDSGVGQTNLKKSEVLDCPVVLPVDKKEQSAIASTLSDMNVLIKKFEKLIEKKKNIKQGAMQELLTGKRRLPGFSGKWESKKLGEIIDYKNGKSLESHITDGGDYYLITLNSLDIKGKLKSDHLKVGINDGSLSKDDLVMILSDVAHGNFLGLTDVIPEDDKYVLNQRVGALKNIRNVLPCYLSRYINLKQRYFKTAGQGSSQQNLAKDDILNFEVNFPKIEEQTAIENILSDMDSEIEKLESQLMKYQNIKQGMMQTLLTGKIRLLTK